MPLADRLLFNQRLLTEGMTNCPAGAIVNMGGRSLWMFTHDRRLLLEKLCDHFWEYGRANGWVWSGNAHLLVSKDAIPPNFRSLYL